MRKHILSLTFLLATCMSANAQRIGVTVFGGGSVTTDQNTPAAGFERQSSRFGYLGGIEGHLKLLGWKLGLGLSAEKLELLSKANAVNQNGEPMGRIKSDIASPATSVYAIVGRDISLLKVFVTPQVMAGYVNTKSGESTNIELAYPKGSGFNAGFSVTAGYKAKFFRVGLRTGLSYYSLKHDGFSERNKILTIPVALSLSVGI